MSFFRNKKRLRPRSPSASACVCGELIQGRRKSKKCFFRKWGAKYTNLEAKCTFPSGWGEHMKQRGSKYEHFASVTLARAAI